MSWYAIEAVRDSVVATKRLLSMATPGGWLKLAVLAWFVGVGPPLATDFNLGPIVADELRSVATAPGGSLPWVVAGAVALGLLGVAYGIGGAILEFVLVEVLRTRRIRLRSFGRRWWRVGLRLFVLRVALLAAAIATLAAVALSTGSIGESPVGTGTAVAIGAVVVAPIILVNRFTTVFVVPVVLVSDSTVIAGWRRFAPVLAADWRQYTAYAVVDALVVVAVLVLGGALAGLAATLVLLPFVVFGTALFGVLVGVGLSPSIVGTTILALLVVPTVLCVLVAGALVTVPFLVYSRYIPLFVLGDTADRYDPLPAVRADVRE